jgi:hypothetical protein
MILKQPLKRAIGPAKSRHCNHFHKKCLTIIKI